MAQALQVDWMMIQGLYLKGLTPKQIQEQTGVKADTVSGRAFRYKWTKSRIDSSVIVKAHNDGIEQVRQEGPSLSKQSDRVRRGLAGVLERSLDRLDGMTFKSPKAALKANQELESVVRNAKTVFGWSEGQAQPSVRIAIMGSTSVQVQDGSETGSVIDVESSKVLTDKAQSDQPL